MMARYIVGDSLSVLRTLPTGSVDLVLSSPPFLGLRSYLPPGHPDKDREMGSEPTPGEYIDGLLDVVEECRRVLAPHGSLCLELGDTYAGSGGAGGDYSAGGLRDGQEKFDGSGRKARRLPGDYPNRDDYPRPSRNGRRSRADDEATGIPPVRKRPGPDGRDRLDGWPLDKSLCMVPELLRLALVYGVNPLTGRTTERWRVRNVVRWCRPNPPVGALGDKVRPATSDMVIACTSRRRYFDIDAVRTSGGDTGNADKCRLTHNPAGAPPLDHWWHDDEDGFNQDAWLIPTEPYRGAHYATWPSALLVRPIEAMCPRRVCTVCGEPSRRRVTASRTLDGQPAALPAIGNKERLSAPPNGIGHRRLASDRQTTGWTDCRCPGGDDRWRPGVVLDPFAGSGTTLAVAHGHGRSSVGVDLDARNAELARQRVGMWLEVEHVDSPARRS